MSLENIIPRKIGFNDLGDFYSIGDALRLLNEYKTKPIWSKTELHKKVKCVNCGASKIESHNCEYCGG